jgi:hypothetical protein
MVPAHGLYRPDCQKASFGLDNVVARPLFVAGPPFKRIRTLAASGRYVTVAPCKAAAVRVRP